MLSVELLGRTLIFRLLDDLVVPDVAAVLHLTLGAGSLDHDDVLERLQLAHLLVDRLLDVRGLALAPGAVDSDQRLGLRELHALANRAGGEAAEHHVVRCADAGARQHRHHNLGDHRQEDPDDVALLDAEIFQRVGQLLRVAKKVGVGEILFLAFLAAPVEGDAIAVSVLDMAVEAVIGRVDLAVLEPLVERRVGLVDVLGRLLEPVELLGLLHPPALPVLLGLLVDRWIVEQRVLGELLGRFERFGVEHLLELGLEAFLGRVGGRVCHRHLSFRFLSLGLLPRRAEAEPRPVRGARARGFAYGRTTGPAATPRARRRLFPPSPARRVRAGPRPGRLSRLGRGGGCPRRSRGWPVS